MTPSLSDLRTRLAAQAHAFGITGLSAAVVSPATGPLTFAAGNTVDGLAVDADTPFSVASSGKHATAVAILELAQAGRVDLEDPIGRLLDDVPAAWSDRTIASLLHHTSGLPDYLSGDDGDAIPRSRSGFFDRYGTLAPYFDSGHAWCYSNTNYILLGFLVARSSGQSYADALRRRILDRADCTDVAAGGPTIPARQTDASMATVYAAIEAETRTRDVVGDGDLVLSARGAHQWHRVLSTDTVLGAGARQRLVEPATMLSGRVVPYGCGWFVDSLSGRATHWHAGHFDGWTAFFYRMPATDTAIYLMSNVALGNTRAQRYLAQWLLEALAPGSTPLSLAPIHDTDATLTAITREALLRPDGAPPDPALFASELRLLIERVFGPRSVLNLWCGEEPASFELVEEEAGVLQTMRRYRVTYAARVEHVQVGYAADGRIFWAWPV